MALKGIAFGNKVVYQGLTLSNLPAYFLANNCAICTDLFTVLIIPNNLGINYSIQYVPQSQYWFIISFSYSSSRLALGINPTFQFTVQLKAMYASYFTPADMAQLLVSQVSSAQYPSTPVPTASNSTYTLAALFG
jgi:hypothetical protein